MKRKILVSLIGLLSFAYSQAQVVTVYQENFDPPTGPNLVTTSNTNALLNSAWNDTNNLFVSAPMSYHSRVVPFDSVIFETTSFSTIGNVFVRLKFNQICKIHFGQRGYVQVSNNGGTTWTNVSGTMYQGPSPQFSATGYFNELSYPSAAASIYWFGPTLTAGSIVAPTNNWWSEETFNVSTLLGGANGYANCKVRFIVVHQINTPINLSGWYVDNLLVEAAPCELQPPTFTYNVTPIQKPVGARYMTNETVKLKARDNSGIDSVKIHWRINGGSWMINKMTALTSGSCPDSSIFTYNWSGLLLNDTLDWYVNIYDCACPNITRDPIVSALPNYYTFWIDLAPPAICGPTYPNSFPLVVSQLPYTEDFESNTFWVSGTGTGATGTAHRGGFPTDNPPLGKNWSVAPNPITTGFAWSVRNTATATSQTGPAGGNTTNGGSKFLYCEASQGSGSSTNPAFTQLITPCIDLPVGKCAALEFYYHMYGANIDRLRVDIDTGTATSSYVNGIWVKIGQQQVSELDPYKKAFVSLEQYAGKIIRIRFTGRKNTTLAQDKNDIAIDDIRVFEPTPVDIEMVSYLAPLNGFCGYGTTENVQGKLQSLGCQTLTKIPVACRIEFTPISGSPVTNTFLRDTLNGSYGLSKDTTFSFGPKANLSAYGTYRLWIYSETANDTTNGNDTVGPYTVEHFQPVTAFPYLLDFDGAGTTPGNGTPANSGVTGNTDWERIPNPVNNGYAFYVHSGKTPSAATGPRTDYSGTGNYLYTEGNYGTSPTTAIYASKCLNLTGMTNPSIEFMYHMYGADIGAVAVQIVPANSNQWINIPSGSIASTGNQTASIDTWKFFKADLNTWAGQTVKLRILAQKTGLGSASDVAIDNIRVYNRIATDVGIIQINLPAQRIDTTAPVAPQFVIRNYGTSAVTGVPITYTITPSCGPNAGVAVTYTITYSGTIAAGAEFVYNAPTIPLYPVGSFKICANTTKAGDTHAFNNSYCKTSNGWPQIYIQNGFAENFDACNTGVASGFWINGDYRTFDVGNATFSSSPNSYSTYQFPYNSYANTNEYLFAPRFIGFDTIVGAQIWFRHKFQFGASGDAGLLELLQGANWVPLGFQDPDDAIGINWYNSANLPSANNGSAFTGNSSNWAGNTNGWITSMWPLNIYNRSTAPLILRWRQINAGGGTVGWAIDDLEIRIPPQNSASPYEIDTEEYLVFPNIPATIQVKVQNTGAKQLDSCMVSFKIDNGAWSAPEKVVFSPKLITGRVSSAYHNFSQLWTNPISGTHTVCVVTSRPNNKQDNYIQDDTLCVQIKVLDEIIFTPTDTQYCTSFDNPAQVDWIEKNTSNKKGLVSWQKGSPNQAPLIGAHSPPNAWMTKLNTNYKTRDSSSLFTPVFVVDSGTIFDINFWHSFKTELYHDGGSVDISFDGKTWRTVGYVLPNGDWFNTTHVTSLEVLKPGWTGESSGWINSEIKIQFDQFRKAVLRFRFASDQSFEYQGWAIDDFCMTASDGEPDDFIGIDEPNTSDLIGVGNVIPNPTNGQTQIPYVMNSPVDIKVSVYSLLGQQLMNFNQASEVGVNYINFDVTGWTAGMYIVAIEVNGEQITRKVVVR